MKRYFLSAIVALALAPVGDAIVDFNTNGLSDLWEKQYNNDELFPETFDPQADPDKDGWTTAQEAGAGTNPFDSNPPDGLIRPEIVHIPAVLGEPDENGTPVVITPEAVTVTWPTIPGKQYTLLFSPDLTEGSWIPVGTPFIGNGNDPVYGFEIHESDKRFWRVAATDTDTDGDGLTDAEEATLGTDPGLVDTDGDGLSDAEEARIGSNPNNANSDDDGIADGEDAVPTDGAIWWPKTPVPHYVLIETGVSAEPVDGYWPSIEDINRSGEILFYKGEAYDNEYNVWNPDGNTILDASPPDYFDGESTDFIDASCLAADGSHHTTFVNWWFTDQVSEYLPLGSQGWNLHFPGSRDDSPPQISVHVDTVDAWSLARIWDVQTNIDEYKTLHLENGSWIDSHSGSCSIEDFPLSINPQGHILFKNRVVRPGSDDLTASGAPFDDFDRLGSVLVPGANPGDPSRPLAVVVGHGTSGGSALWVETPESNILRASTQAVLPDGGRITENGIGLLGNGVWLNGRSQDLDSLVSTPDWSDFQSAALATNGMLAATAIRQATGNREITLLAPIEVVSRDKYFAGSFVIPDGWDNLEMEFVNTASSENLGKYGSLLGGGTTKIYNSVDDVMSESDVLAGSQPATQKVWFVRDSSNARKINYYTCFNAVGAVEIRLWRSGLQVAAFHHMLTEAADFAETIRYVNEWVKGVGFDFSGGGGTIPMAMGAPAVNGFGDESIEHLTRAALIPFFNVINQVEGLQNIAVGLFDGARAGINDDWKLLVLIKNGAVAAGGWTAGAVEAELLKWRDDPLKRASELKEMAARVCKDWVFEPLKAKRRELSTWDGFKNQSWEVWKSIQGTAVKGWTVTKAFWSDICTGFSSWMDDFGARMIEGAEKTHWSESVFPMDKFQQIGNAATTAGCYALGYSTGYIAEQVAVGVVTGGVVKVGTILTKGGVKMAGLLAARRVLPVVARLQLVKKWAASVAISIEMKAVVERGLAEAAKLPLTTAVKECPLEIIETALRKPMVDRSVFGTRNLIDDLLPAKNPKVYNLLAQEATQAVPFQKLGFFLHMIDNDVDTELVENFLKFFDRKLILDAGPELDWLDDFLRATEGIPGRFNTRPPLAPPMGTWRADIIREITRPGGSIWSAPPVGPAPRGTIVEVHLAHTDYLGWTWSPTQAAVDFMKEGIAVQLKTLSTADVAPRMKDAIDALLRAHASTPFEKMILDMRVKPGLDTIALRTELTDYIGLKVADDELLDGKIQFTITEYELNPH